ncbi:hypothetical protein L1887_05660 [Cichorium endivia]|nr:hypothetical protein L1887_05660 [Cichorium endivia]
MAVGEEGTSLEFTPTWVFAALCAVIVGISIAVERLLHFTGNQLTNQKPLFEALQKIKEELMLLGFISLLLPVFQSKIIKICVKKSIMDHLLPCSLSDRDKLAEEATTMGYCASKGKVPLLSPEALDNLHIFIFVLAVVHVTFSALTVVFGMAKMREWEHWEESITKDDFNTSQVLSQKTTYILDLEYFGSRFWGIGKSSAIRGWLHSVFKQFCGAVSKSDYVALRLGFVTKHCPGNPKYNFHKYMIRALEEDFKEVTGISWYLWVFVIVFLLLNINGWHTYFWIASVPLLLLLAVGTKLEHIIIQLAHEVAEKHTALIAHQAVIEPSDDHFWFGQPKYLLFFIHFILFQNAFEIAFVFWIWVQFGFNSCIMGELGYIIPRLIIGVFIQVLCSYSTLPLYALLTQMGTHFKPVIFPPPVREAVTNWAHGARNRVAHNGETNGSAEDAC